ncbi:LANO_0A06612g1_1 [Lachancea nothofagi CBS 11611]|uniref:LANO_0A06612g1_1 n=1 Tax=Lachancea nothofagi CBS 11611 TaxID=1266666 RepID=A0A1G4IS58_9SACH|nr:LANO_0A06612g1_1 [Lachancea nothofagi CBS 11611]
MSVHELGDVSAQNEERTNSNENTKEDVNTSMKTGDQGPDVAEDLVPDVILPSNFSKCSRGDLVILISRMLSFLIQINDSAIKSEHNELTRFHSRVPPQISVYDYLMRLTRYSALEPAVLISSVYYIDLLSAIYPAFSLNSLTVHRFLLTATAVASKGLCDAFCTNTHYSKVGGVQCSELHVLENEFLKRVNYRILPRDDNILCCKMERQEGLFVTDTYPEGNVRGPNNGFNVLDTYYRKIIEIVGSYDSSPDKTKKAHYSMEPLLKKHEIEPSNKKRVLEDSEIKTNSNKKPA